MGSRVVDLFWQVASNTPMILAFFACVYILISKRRVAPRACVVAATVYVTLCLVQPVSIIALQVLIREFNGGRTLSRATCVMLIRALRLFHDVMFAYGIVMLIWCILVIRKPVPVADE